MLNRNYENLLASVLESTSAYYAHLPVIGANGLEYFLTGDFNFPYSCVEGFAQGVNDAGICLGTGTTPATRLDMMLENPITDGVNVVVTSKVLSCEGGAPQLEYLLTVTNMGGEALTISEIGYRQTVRAARISGDAGSASSVVCLLDRTVLSAPVTIQAEDAGVIRYTLKTAPVPKTVNGVNIVSFTYGTDAQISAMIDAARQGLIDLHTDGGWAVGDVRTIHIDAFTGGNSVTHAAQDIDIAISQFGDYNSCGALFQVDFVQTLEVKQRMSATATNVGGYGATEMYTTTLPALVNALPSWLSTRLKTFSVLTSAGNQSTTIESVTGNKLALRSEVELSGAATVSAAGEGSQVEWYKFDAARYKRSGRTGSVANSYWLRSPAANDASKFCNRSGNNTLPVGTNVATLAYGVAPFGCVG